MCLSVSTTTQSRAWRFASTILNKPFIDATIQLKGLAKKFKAYFCGAVQKQETFARIRQNNGPSVTSFATVDEPTEAKYLWAEIGPPIGDRQRVAEVFKMGKKSYTEMVF
jgi:hypothetical protein